MVQVGAHSRSYHGLFSVRSGVDCSLEGRGVGGILGRVWDQLQLSRHVVVSFDIGLELCERVFGFHLGCARTRLDVRPPRLEQRHRISLLLDLFVLRHDERGRKVRRLEGVEGVEGMEGMEGMESVDGCGR